MLVLAVAGGAYAVALVRGGFSARGAPSALEAGLARAARGLSVSARTRALRSPMAATPDVLAAARAHWADHCASCHANDGGGDTPLGKNLYPKAPDLRAPATQRLSDGELYRIIQDGVRLSGMPAWGADVDDDSETWALVAFIRHLPQLEAPERAAMERMNPRSPEEWREEEQEEDFLHGGSAPPATHELHSH